MLSHSSVDNSQNDIIFNPPLVLSAGAIADLGYANRGEGGYTSQKVLPSKKDRKEGQNLLDLAGGHMCRETCSLSIRRCKQKRGRVGKIAGPSLCPLKSITHPPPPLLLASFFFHEPSLSLNSDQYFLVSIVNTYSQAGV